MTIKKKILINGSARSGTTFIGLLISRFTGDLVIEEPIYLLSSMERLFLQDIELPEHERVKEEFKNLIKNLDKISLFKIYKKHSTFLKNFRTYFFNSSELKEFLLEFKSYHIKEVLLHFYLDEDFIKENWNIFHILRHPVDNYLSFMRKIINNNIINKINSYIYDIQLLNSDVFSDIKKYLIKYFNKNAYKNIENLIKYYVSIKEPSLKDLNDVKMTVFKNTRSIFLFRWILTNYYAINCLNKKKILIFDKKETLYKLFPNNAEFEELVNRNYKIPNYRDKSSWEKLNNEFKILAKKMDLVEEYDFLLEHFN